MEKTMRTLLFVPLLGLSLIASAAAQARDSDSAPAAVAAIDTGTEIHLVQRVEREIGRDRIDATLRVEEEGTDPVKVQAEVNRRMAEALATARREASVKIATSGYSVYQESPNGTASAKWHASQTMTLVSKDFGAALALVGTLQGSGLLVGGLGFDVAPETLRAAEDELTAEALAGLHARAERIAADLTMNVARYKSIEIGNAVSQESSPVRMLVLAAAPMPAPSPAAQPGQSVVSLTVDARVTMVPAAERHAEH